jgi:oligoribonuclease
MSKYYIPHGFLWMDLEMTGLDEKLDPILEVAVIITDVNLNEIATFQSLVGQDLATLTDRFAKNDWWAEYPANKKHFLENCPTAASMSELQTNIIDLAKEHLGDQKYCLAGNSIHNDRKFIVTQMSELEKSLHYRMLDVSAWKVLMQTKYKSHFQKPETHRALDDIRGSIEELQFYLKFFNK